MSSDRGYDRFLTIFSPEGRLYQIEYAMNAVRRCDVSAVGLKGDDCCVIVSQKKLEDPRMDNKLIDFSSVSRLYSITPAIGAVVVGSWADGKSVITRCRQEAADFNYQNGYSMPVSMLAKRVADLSQTNTQHAGRRTMGVDIIFVAVDEEVGPQVYKVDPSGHYLSYKACSSGKLGQECTSILERKLGGDKEEKKFDGQLKSCIQTAIMALQEAAKIDFNSDNLEVGVVRNGAARFERLAPAEIEQHLNEIAERD